MKTASELLAKRQYPERRLGIYMDTHMAEDFDRFAATYEFDSDAMRALIKAGLKKKRRR